MTKGRDFGNSGEKSFSRAAGMEAKLGRADCQVAGQPDEMTELDQGFLGRRAHGLLNGHLASPLKVTCYVTCLGHAPL